MYEKKSVLIICRTAAGQMYLGVVLNRICYAPVLVRSVEEGVLLAQNINFSLILFDSDMPKTSLELAINLLRKDPSLKNLPLVVFRTSDNPVTNEALIAQGCTAVLTKPLDLAILYGLLQRLSNQPRTTPRIPVKIRVEIQEGIPEKVLTCTNLSESGMYLRTLSPLPEETVIHVKFNLPFDEETIELGAKVVRTLELTVQLESDPGMGLSFVDIPENSLIRIRNFVQWEIAGDLEWNSTL